QQVNRVAPGLAQHQSESATAREGQEVLFSEDFANGFDGNNGLGSWTTAGTDGNIWRYTFSGPVGAYSDPSEAIQAPASVANGWMIFNSDSANTNWSDTTIVAAPVPFVGSLISP